MTEIFEQGKDVRLKYDEEIEASYTIGDVKYKGYFLIYFHDCYHATFYHESSFAFIDITISGFTAPEHAVSSFVGIEVEKTLLTEYIKSVKFI